MASRPDSLLATEAACRLGVSVKALRLYEQRGLLRPARTEAGYRQYGPADLRAAQDIVALRALGLSLAQVALVLKGDAAAMDQALALREAELAAQFAAMQGAGARLRELRDALARGAPPRPGDLADALGSQHSAVSFTLPWPWGGELFTLPALAPLTFLVGPLGSGKTRLALQLAETLPDTIFLPQRRLEDTNPLAHGLALSPEEIAKVNTGLGMLQEDGAVDTEALRLLLAALEASGGRCPLVIDMIEEGLARPSQEALMPFLRRRLKTRPGPVIAMTRSSSILDLASVGPSEAILYCPANHAVPFLVAPFTGAPGYEALASCLASPEVRERVSRHARFTA